MKELIEFDIKKLDWSEYFFVVVQPYGGERIKSFSATGLQVITLLKKTFHYEEGERGDVFLARAENMNGDGFDYIIVYKL